ncbi:tetratricopeptide repeat protein [Maribacter algarum]|uniref:Tetratricopeptide repeat protein n=1 Tax=Maribacter algarum (ex Zhang et al. 2020) TaxID=2578118 RepID=A0A5S3QKK9_9FLAO|nr:tetratricopeptide repeat protein [Maribacter algarum]TMM58374.1 tetratricopeptide repeat protein [Maribacter algarum]
MKKFIFLILLLLFFKAEAQTSALAIADSLYAIGNYTKAINFYAEVGSQKGNLQIARAYNSIGNYAKAIAQYESLIGRSPELQIARFELGKLYLKTKRFDEGRKLFAGLVGDDANNPEYLYYQGESFRELDQGASSLVAYKKAVEVDSTHLKSIFQLGKHFVITREKANALEYLNKGLKFYPDDVSLINLKALALFNNDNYEEALPLFESLIDLGEKKEFVYTKLAYCYFKTWEFEKAKSTYKHLIAMDEDNEDAYFNLGHVFFKDRQTDSATYYIKKSIEVQKVTFEKEYESLARFARTEEDLNTSLKYYRLAFDEDRTNYRVYYQICALMDQVSNDPKVKLEYYENFIKKFGKKKPYISDFVLKRISEIKQELHFAKD